MQDISSTVSFSPSFSFYVSGDSNIAEAAVRVVRESQSYYSVKVDGGDEDAEFEFETSPLREESFFHFPTTATTDKEEEDADRVTSKNLFYGGWTVDQSLSSPSESEDLSPSRYYCLWTPNRSPARGDSSKSKSSRRCRIKDFLRRSHSDGAVSTTSEPKRCSFKDLLRRSHSHSDGGGSASSISSSGNGSPVVKGKNKTASHNKLSTSIGEVNTRRKTYLPYRQDLIVVFAGRSRFRQ
ncbi:Uncharacterized protein Rs2_06673 [Raphanus sativus]|uniref:Uncharacterized protein LOC108840731 n=1 Tax=Raphanus sativus TaxID=3726 RepID=A0A9W3C890_RAPSA|nr:uncharacterized protein LOC108840731 [Raphanus sativus]KAJ4912052.1 Uncharacterized protein Rs2_06673 [Raphanus sativus]